MPAPAATRTSSWWSCLGVPQPAGAVSLDRVVSVANSDGSNAHPPATSAPPGAPVSAAVRGAVLASWSASGTQIGYPMGSDVVLAPAGGRQAQIVASGLSGPSIGTDYYAKAPWEGGATWATGPGSP